MVIFQDIPNRWRGSSIQIHINAGSALLVGLAKVIRNEEGNLFSELPNRCVYGVSVIFC